MQASREELERHQIWVYAVALVLGALIGFARPEAAPSLERLIYPVLGILLYVTFLQVPIRELRRALSQGRYLVAVLVTNFLVVPIVTWLLTRLAPQEPAILLGIYLVLLTPCIDYVIVFTRLGGGDENLVLASTPLLMVAQLLLLPLYLWLFMGAQLQGIVSAGPFLEAFLVLIVLPLGLAQATEAWGARQPAGVRWMATVGWLPVPFMALTLLVVVASQLHEIQGSLPDVASVVPIYAGFLLIIAGVAPIATRWLALGAGAGRALLFSSATRNSLVVLPLALGLPEAFALTPAVIVIQTMVELAGLLVYVRLAPWIIPNRARRPAGTRPSLSAGN